VAEPLLVALVVVAGFAIVAGMNVHGKARAYGRGPARPAGHRPPDAVTRVELPSPRFNRRETDHRRGSSQ
jgi:hypothetical protein